MIPTSRVLALLCDADGNLFPSEEPAFVASADVTNAFLASYGVTRRYTPEELRLGSTGKNFRTTAVDLAVAHGVAVEPSLAGRHPGAVTEGPTVLTAQALQEWVQEEKAQVTRHLGTVLRPDPSVLEPLTRLSSAHRLAAVSSSALGRLEACFTATGLDGLIPPSERYSAEDSLPVPTSKPDPAVYLYACAQLGLDPAQAVAVEDSVPGAQSAVAAGIPTVGNVQFVPGAEREERVAQLREAGVFAVITTWAELEPLLEPLERTA
ncbi:MAG: HAD-superfamily hydrolase, subfamily variant 3 [Frankiales bacterium]|nr:HAD-superfamily hydrolase, subfamily variant 3 [Frankiales bacterium]